MRRASRKFSMLAIFVDKKPGLILWVKLSAT